MKDLFRLLYPRWRDFKSKPKYRKKNRSHSASHKKKKPLQTASEKLLGMQRPTILADMRRVAGQRHGDPND